VTQAAAPAPTRRRTGHIRAVGGAVLAGLAALIAIAAPWTERVQTAWFDAYQAMRPRVVRSMPVTIVEIDDASQAKLGQWPWPRSLLAELVTAIDASQPAAVALDILMPEPDAWSPERLLARGRSRDPSAVSPLASLPSHDSELAHAVEAASVVMAVTGSDSATEMQLRPPLFGIRDSAPRRDDAGTADALLPHYAGALTSIDEINRKAGGWGLISVEPAGGVVRRIPLAASIDGTLVPALAIEMLRVAKNRAQEKSALRLLVAGPRVEGVAVGDFVVPTEEDGAVRIYYSPHSTARFVSAVDVLAGKVDPARLAQKLVLVGVGGKGLVDSHATPLGETMSGSEIHAQLLENLYDHTLLRRPGWARVLETALFLALGTLLIWATPRWRPQYAALLALASIAAPFAVGFLLFRTERMLFDAAMPALSLMLLFGVLLVLTLAEAMRERKSLERVVAQQREQGARIAGEFEAAQRIQTGSLPRADLLQGDARIDLAATMVPAREVGGDLYDFFRLDERRLFVLVGDVAGKGLSASIFMAVSKALYKSTMLRSPDADIGDLMSAANAEVSRDNPEMLFVTALAGILDLASGEFVYCNAGHPYPFLIDRAGGGSRVLDGASGPPLCAVADFVYESARVTLLPGDLVCLLSDGVTEAQNAAGDFYGSERARRLLLDPAVSAAAAGTVVDALQADVEAFAAGTPPADDLTILALRWNGPGNNLASGR
jgi:adenylate cyclase